LVAEADLVLSLGAVVLVAGEVSVLSLRAVVLVAGEVSAPSLRVADREGCQHNHPAYTTASFRPLLSSQNNNSTT
jgi:hypothetical protein